MMPPVMCAWKLPPPLDDGVPAKILKSLDEVVARVAHLREQGKRVVMTNGGFDLLHVGHVRSLRHARALGNHLVVAVNSDASVRRAKGPDRPMFPLQERMELLASLECVDTVFSFEDDTANRILATVRPDVHAKGTDYGGHTPERDTVLAYGGTIAVVGDPKDHASSELQSRLRGGAEGTAQRGED